VGESVITLSTLSTLSFILKNKRKEAQDIEDIQRLTSFGGYEENKTEYMRTFA
jgi:hypothetical protein